MLWSKLITQNLKSILNSTKKFFSGQHMDWLIYHHNKEVINYYCFDIQCGAFGLICNCKHEDIVASTIIQANDILHSNIFICNDDNVAMSSRYNSAFQWRHKQRWQCCGCHPSLWWCWLIWPNMKPNALTSMRIRLTCFLTFFLSNWKPGDATYSIILSHDIQDKLGHKVQKRTTLVYKYFAKTVTKYPNPQSHLVTNLKYIKGEPTI